MEWWKQPDTLGDYLGRAYLNLSFPICKMEWLFLPCWATVKVRCAVGACRAHSGGLARVAALAAFQKGWLQQSPACSRSSQQSLLLCPRPSGVATSSLLLQALGLPTPEREADTRIWRCCPGLSLEVRWGSHSSPTLHGQPWGLMQDWPAPAPTHGLQKQCKGPKKGE